MNKIYSLEEINEITNRLKEAPDFTNDNEVSTSLELAMFGQAGIFPTKEMSPNSSTNMIYAFTNEQLDKLYPHLPSLKGKRVFTVGSSGDQLLTALYEGATDITFADVNSTAKYYIELKMACIKNLTFEEFHKFFTSEDFLTPYLYRKISHDLSLDSQIFWDSILLEFNSDNPFYSGFIFHKSLYWTNDKLSQSIYCYEICYNQLQKILRKGDFSIKYHNAELSEFPQVAEGLYDFINLSNISTYLDYFEYREKILPLIERNLAPDGKIEIGYTWGGHLFGDTRLKEFHKTFPEYQIEKIEDEFDSEGAYLLSN